MKRDVLGNSIHTLPIESPRPSNLPGRVMRLSPDDQPNPLMLLQRMAAAFMEMSQCLNQLSTSGGELLAVLLAAVPGQVEKALEGPALSLLDKLARSNNLVGQVRQQPTVIFSDEELKPSSHEPIYPSEPIFIDEVEPPPAVEPENQPVSPDEPIFITEPEPIEPDLIPAPEPAPEPVPAEPEPASTPAEPEPEPAPVTPEPTPVEPEPVPVEPEPPAAPWNPDEPCTPDTPALEPEPTPAQPPASEPEPPAEKPAKKPRRKRTKKNNPVAPPAEDEAAPVDHKESYKERKARQQRNVYWRKKRRDIAAENDRAAQANIANPVRTVEQPREEVQTLSDLSAGAAAEGG